MESTFLAFIVSVLGKFTAKLIGDEWDKVTHETRSKLAARVYSTWFDDTTGGDDAKARALRSFLANPATLEETGKILEDRYHEVDFDRLTQEFWVACKKEDVTPPKGDIADRVDAMMCDLADALREVTAQDGHGTLRRILEAVDRSEARVRNDTRARAIYLERCADRHKFIRFLGMAAAGDGMTEVSMEQVFVMPRVQPQDRQEQDFPAHKLLLGRKPPRRIMLLGKPGGGKSTLLECLTLALASRATREFPWAKDLPDLLPVFIRVRDLDKALDGKCTVWDILARRCTNLLQLAAPTGFLYRQREPGLLLLFDGLDEAASPARRRIVMDDIHSFAATLPASCRVIVTSRPHDYARDKFDQAQYAHYDICDFDGDEIKTFIGKWQAVREKDAKKAEEKTNKLLGALQRNRRIAKLAPNALLLTMIVREHYSSGGNLPDTRAQLYAKCSETLLKTWMEAKDQEGYERLLDTGQMETFLGRLAFSMQTSDDFAGADEDLALTRPRRDIEEKLRTYLRDELGPQATPKAEKLVEQLSSKDAILVNYGNEKFGFVHRTFQEFYAARHLVQEEDPKGLHDRIFEQPSGWNETLCLAVAQMVDGQRRPLFVELLRKGLVPFAQDCLEASGQQANWLQTLVRFLVKHYWQYREHRSLTPAGCAAAIVDCKEIAGILKGLFTPEHRDGPALAAAVELAELLARKGDPAAASLLSQFWQEAAGHPADELDDMVPVGGGVLMGKYPVTNSKFERMVPGHRQRRDRYSDQDDQPVIYVNRFEAELYCRWLGGGSSAYRLPSEEEWLNAWGDREYPWGDVFDKNKCNTGESGHMRTTPVRMYAKWASPAGCCDLAGNVWEWTSSQWAPDDPDPVIRGGSWGVNSGHASRSRGRNSVDPENRNNNVGFRLSRT
ncbi:MAG: SUMF1/EgtB/PvdO family nonheme iron enzyme [Bryobacteraceae bacterium]